MKSLSQQKQIVLSFVPLLLYLAAEMFLSTEIAALAAVFTGLITLLIIRISTGVFDRFLLYDTLLLSALGIASFVFKNEIFFNLKPAITQMLIVGYLTVPLFITPSQFEEFIVRAGMGIFKPSIHQIPQLRRNFAVMYFLFGIHTLILFYGGFHWSSATCITFSGVGLLAVPILALIIIKAETNIRTRREEYVPWVDEQGIVKGKVSRKNVHNGSKLLHPVVHCHLINSSGQVFLQQRSFNAQIQAGKWDTAVGGHVKWGEPIEKALLREMKEETGLIPRKAIPFAQYIWESDVEKELVFSFIEFSDTEPTINRYEAEAGKWWTLGQIKSQPGEIFTPNLLHELQLMEEKKVLKA